MALSIFDLFKVGIGPSSSHTVGPMVAGNRFLAELEERQLFEKIASVRIDLYGSLAMTGEGHATDVAIMIGLGGEAPDSVDPDSVLPTIENIRKKKKIVLAGKYSIDFIEKEHLIFNFGHSLPKHPNGMKIQVSDDAGIVLYQNIYYSVGGGFVLSDAEIDQKGSDTSGVKIPYPFENAKELIELADKNGLTISEMVLENEKIISGQEKLEKGLDQLWAVMDGCIRRGCEQTGILPGGLNIRRRANKLKNDLISKPEAAFKDSLGVMDWVNLFAIAVNEENAAGGRVVTAPTNGAAGVIPAVLAYYDRFVHGSTKEGIRTFLTTSAAIGMLYKKNASISAAEVGCQGEIGVACSMAAGALCAVMGGTNQQIENAAEIGMEHNLGLTCDPIGGLVQVPCIERNTMGAVKAINAARLAMQGDGEHHVPLDSVIETMRQTGVDMQEKYKETSTGGLAVNVVAC
ncbi:L-serine ammonia-lyase [Pelagibaculum spongiae]|uniref:L-serine dehydratase n=1 Tax=Pelagibaculum spongiae TaxID=2080658 RepID=A0A2V1GUV7_9GAMM|nr:L-serine ammonia-lyase [Pelagibaculum spongiae]PVZ63465.1 L-serine ammonia-lyase [Pelagibaculum spongiae]